MKEYPETKDSKVSLAIKGSLLGAVVMAANSLPVDPETLERINDGCSMMMGWSMNRLTSAIDKIEAAKYPRLEELEINGHLTRLASVATKYVLRSEMRDRELGIHFDEKSLELLRKNALENWLSFPDQVKLQSQAFTELVTTQTMNGRAKSAFTSQFWKQFIEFSLRSAKPPGSASREFINSLAEILCQKFPEIFFELAKSTARNKPETFASIQLHFLGAIRHGQQKTDEKIDHLTKLLIDSVGSSTGRLKPREVTRLSKATAQLFVQFDEMRPLLERMPEHLRNELGIVISDINKVTRNEGEKTRTVVNKGNLMLGAGVGAMIAMLLWSTVWQEHRNRKAEEKSAHVERLVNEVRSSKSLPTEDQARAIDAAHRRFAKLVGIEPEGVEADLVAEATLLAAEAEVLRKRYRDNPQGSRDWPRVFWTFMRAGEMANSVQAFEQAGVHYQQAFDLAEDIEDKAGQAIALLKLAECSSEEKTHLLHRRTMRMPQV